MFQVFKWSVFRSPQYFFLLNDNTVMRTLSFCGYNNKQSWAKKTANIQ